MFPIVILSPITLMAASLPPIKPGILTKSTHFAGGDYLLPSASENGSVAALVIQGDNITVDFGGAILRGTPEAIDPDKRQGIGLLVRGKNVTIKNVHVRGYKIGIEALGTAGLRILDSDFSYNWKQHLASTREREDLSDWMSYHQNEKDEWRQYGAGIYLRDCDDFEVRNCRITSGQCGLMLTRCNQGLVWNNDFSFLSGIGIGLYRSSKNRIVNNKVDWCVRGYSHGIYNRGQDSAGILVYEQSNQNTFAYNSVTHGGDGFFLWAGQTTMDTGLGGCNDNLVYGNDFSHAPTNGIEATFSRNTFANNKVLECWHGVWGGYSFDTKILGNLFGFNAEAIAIEHGQNNTIQANDFRYDNTGILLWANDTQDPNWGYPKHHDTISHNYKITNNTFLNTFTAALSLRKTQSVLFEDNRLVDTPAMREQPEITGLTLLHNKVENPAKSPSTVPTIQSSGNPVLDTESDETAYLQRFSIPWNFSDALRPEVDSLAPTPLPGARDAFLKPGALRGRRYIYIDEWGPYDFQRPLLWLRHTEGGLLSFDILGPQGTWHVTKLSPGIHLRDAKGRQEITRGSVPGKVTVSLPQNATMAQLLALELEYTGQETTDYRGIITPAGKPVGFGYAQFFAPIAWNVRFYTWEKGVSDPRINPDMFAARLKAAPLVTCKTDHLDFAGYGRFVPGVPADYFATVAEGTLDIQPGEYILEVTTDDGCRVWVDDKLVIADAWKYQGPTLYAVPLTLGGTHRIHVEHFQIDGYATLRVNLRPKR